MVSEDFPRNGLVLPDRDGWTATEMTSFAERAADAGVESVWCWDGWSYDPFSLLSRIAERTDCALGTAIANVYARSPATLAMNAATVAQATDRPFVLGVGASTPPIVEGLHGESFERPLRRTRETIEIVRMALAGDPIEYQGECFELEGFTFDHVASVSVPVFNAALGRTNVAMTVEYADGIVPNLMPFDAIADAIAAAEGRTGVTADLTVAPVIPLAVDEDASVAREILAKHVAFYVGATDSYHGVVARHGFEGVADDVQDAWANGDYGTAADSVTDALADAVGIWGTPERARRQLDALPDVIDVPLFEFPDGVSQSMLDTGLEVIATAGSS